MKIFLAVLALVACAAGEVWIPKTDVQIKQISIDCLKENPFTPEQIQQLIEEEMPNADFYRKYQLCVAVKLGIFSHDHGLDSERLAKQFDFGLNEKDLKEISEDCVRQSQAPGKAADVFVYDHSICFFKTIGRTH